MMAKMKANRFEGRPVWRRQLGVFACLLAVALALFGHIETSEAVSADSQTAIVMLAQAEGPAEHSNEAPPLHCYHHAQCSFHALLPSPLPVSALAARRVGVSANHLGDSRAVSPLRHPPKTRVLL